MRMFFMSSMYSRFVQNVVIGFFIAPHNSGSLCAIFYHRDNHLNFLPVLSDFLL